MCATLNDEYKFMLLPTSNTSNKNRTTKFMIPFVRVCAQAYKYLANERCRFRLVFQSLNLLGL